jgi:RNA recognition motif-containing protein
VFVGNIPFHAKEESLRTLFEPFENLIGIKMFQGKAFVKFSSKESRDKALDMQNKEF